MEHKTPTVPWSWEEWQSAMRKANQFEDEAIASLWLPSCLPAVLMSVIVGYLENDNFYYYLFKRVHNKPTSVTDKRAWDRSFEFMLYAGRQAIETEDYQLLLWLVAYSKKLQMMRDAPSLIASAAVQISGVTVHRWGGSNDEYIPLEDGLICAHAAELGKLRMLQWLRGQEFEWDCCTCTEAACNNHLQILQWAHENGCGWNTITCGWTAKEGHLHVLQWLRKHGCPWDEYTTRNAAHSGHFAVVKWAVMNGCEFGENTRDAALECNHHHIAQWIQERLDDRKRQEEQRHNRKPGCGLGEL